MKKLFLYLITYALLLSSFSQSYDPGKVDKKAIALYNQAMEQAQDNRLDNAAGLLLQAIQLDSKYLEAWLSLAGVYGQQKNYKASIEYYEKAFGQDAAYTMEYKLPYSINLANMGEFEKALQAINELLVKDPPKNSTSLKAAQYRKRCYEFAVDYAKKNANTNYVFAPQNMGGDINTSESEYFPSLTVDGKEFIFTRRVKGVNEDFFRSTKDSAQWTKAKPIEGDVNTEQNEAAQNISLDGQWLVFAGCYRPDGFGSCDIYISYLDKESWSEPINLGGWINSDQWESQPCLSPDKRDLYFASRRFGGMGGSDIYVSHLQPNGKWGEPENMGEGINTSGDEQSPFIHADNQTLYFTSNYWPGYGDEDLFYVRKGPMGDWSKPINLGYQINTISREGTLFFSAVVKTPFYASDRGDTKGGMDIYSFELREDVRPYKTLWVKGHVFDKKTSKGLPSAVELIDIATKQIISKVQTDE
ncbi:MAG: OmpA family protein, partial [Chitinophagaceae bacterium]